MHRAEKHAFQVMSMCRHIFLGPGNPLASTWGWTVVRMSIKKDTSLVGLVAKAMQCTKVNKQWAIETYSQAIYENDFGSSRIRE
jgi:hypothetical protein